MPKMTGCVAVLRSVSRPAFTSVPPVCLAAPVSFSSPPPSFTRAFAPLNSPLYVPPPVSVSVPPDGIASSPRTPSQTMFVAGITGEPASRMRPFSSICSFVPSGISSGSPAAISDPAVNGSSPAKRRATPVRPTECE